MLEKGGWTQKNLESHHKTILGFKQLLCSHQIHTDPMSFDSNVCLSHSGPLMLSIFAHQSVFFPSLPYLFLKIPHDSSTLWLQRETLLFKFGFMKTKHPLMNTIMLKWKKQSCSLELILFYEVVFCACFSTCFSTYKEIKITFLAVPCIDKTGQTLRE